MKNEILKHAISDWNITKCEELLAIGDVDTNAVIHSRVGVYHDSLDENGYPIPVCIDYTILMHAIDYG